jgi:hypothetical protein
MTGRGDSAIEGAVMTDRQRNAGTRLDEARWRAPAAEELARQGVDGLFIAMSTRRVALLLLARPSEKGAAIPEHLSVRSLAPRGHHEPPRVSLRRCSRSSPGCARGFQTRDRRSRRSTLRAASRAIAHRAPDRHRSCRAKCTGLVARRWAFPCVRIGPGRFSLLVGRRRVAER